MLLATILLFGMWLQTLRTLTPIVVVLKNGEEVQGFIEWYDRTCIKLNCGNSHLLIYKPSIRYMYKAGESQKP